MTLEARIADRTRIVVANAGTIEVATIADVDGHVTIEVWLGEEPSHRQSPRPLWHLPEGAHRVCVYTDAPSQHPQWAEHVDFVID
jgi:hypothetical protein